MIDAPCGNGKTEYIIRYLSAHKEKPFLYISPLRKMFDRLKGEGEYEGKGIKGRTLYTPETGRYNRTKLQSLKEMIGVGVDVMSTHALFLRLDNEAINMFRRYEYELIIDEALDAVTALPTGKKQDNEEDFVFHELKQQVTDQHLKWLLMHGCISIDTENYNRVVWTDAPSGLEHRYEDVERMIKTGSISYVNGTFLIWSFPISAIEAFENVTILTYRFNSSIFKAYLDFYGKSYEHKTVVRDSYDNLFLTEFSSELEKGPQYADLVNVCDANRLNIIGRRVGRGFPLSNTWYSHSDKIQRKAIKDHLINYFRHYCKANSDSVMWTTYKGFEDKVKPSGYIMRSDGRTPSFVPCNSKATEEYKDRYNLAYLIDRHLNPGIKAFFRQKDIIIPEDEYSLSELIQWIFRSRIRNNEPINLYIPSERMRNLLLEWLMLR